MRALAGSLLALLLMAFVAPVPVSAQTSGESDGWRFCSAVAPEELSCSTEAFVVTSSSRAWGFHEVAPDYDGWIERKVTWDNKAYGHRCEFREGVIQVCGSVGTGLPPSIGAVVTLHCRTYDFLPIVNMEFNYFLEGSFGCKAKL